MSVMSKCPGCGMESAEIRCPRCNTLKIVGCTGSCTFCKSKCSTGPVTAPPSREARDDAEHPGTPLER